MWGRSLDFFDYPDYSLRYPGFWSQPHSRMPHGYGLSPSCQCGCGMPTESPIIHEEESTCKDTAAKAKNVRIPSKELEHSLPCEKSPRSEVRNKKAPCPAGHQHQKRHAAKHVPTQDMRSSKMLGDNDFPFVRPPKASAEKTKHQKPEQVEPHMASDNQQPKASVEKTKHQKPEQVEHHMASDNQQPTYNVQTIPVLFDDRSSTNAKPCTLPQVSKEAAERHTLTPMEQLENIEKEMEEVERRVEHFAGVKEDKEYIVLDETMTALLLKLDTVESNGVEQIRNERRRLVRHVQDGVQKLERKVGVVRIETTEAAFEEEK